MNKKKKEIMKYDRGKIIRIRANDKEQMRNNEL